MRSKKKVEVINPKTVDNITPEVMAQRKEKEKKE